MKHSILLAVVFLGAGAAFGQNSAADDIAAAKQAYAAKDYERASKYYQAVLSKSPNSASAYQGIGNCDYYLGKTGEALAAYQKALELNPNNAPLAAFVDKLKAQQMPVPLAAATTNTATVASPGLPSDASNPSSATVASPGLPADAAISSAAVASPGLPPQAAPKTFELDLMGGVAITVPEHYVGQTSTGAGGEIDGLFLVNPQIGIGAGFSYQNIPSRGSYVQLGFQEYENTTLTSSYMNLMALGRFKLNGQGGTPYFLAGAGMCFLTSSGTVSLTNAGNVVSSNSYSTTSSYPLVEAGLGLEFPLGNSGLHLFFQSAYDLIFATNGTSFFVPIDGGLNVVF